MNNPNPCTTCDAYCAFFHVSFYWAEADDAGGTIPATMTKQTSLYHQCTQGANQKNPYYVALIGQPGVNTYCNTYEHRLSTCKEFPMPGEHGVVNGICDRARAKCGLPPLY